MNLHVLCIHFRLWCSLVKVKRHRDFASYREEGQWYLCKIICYILYSVKRKTEKNKHRHYFFLYICWRFKIYYKSKMQIEYIMIFILIYLYSPNRVPSCFFFHLLKKKKFYCHMLFGWHFLREVDSDLIAFCSLKKKSSTISFSTTKKITPLRVY